MKNQLWTHMGLCLTIVFIILCIPIFSLAQPIGFFSALPSPVLSWGSPFGFFPFQPTLALNPFVGGYGNLGYAAYGVAASNPFTLTPFSPLYRPFSPVPAFVSPSPILRNAAATTTVALALPTPIVASAAVPVAPVPIISTSQLFLALLLRIGEESGLFYTNPALFWYIVGLFY